MTIPPSPNPPIRLFPLPVEEDGTVAGSMPEFYMARFKVSVMQGGEEYERLRTHHPGRAADGALPCGQAGARLRLHHAGLDRGAEAQAVRPYLCPFVCADQHALQLSIHRKPTATIKRFTMLWALCWESLLDLSASTVAEQPCETTYFAYAAPLHTASNSEVYQSGGKQYPYLRGSIQRL